MSGKRMGHAWMLRLWVALGVSTGLAALARPAAAELTVADLVAGAVVNVGPFYQDVADAIRDFGAGDYRSALTHLESAKKMSPPLSPPQVMMARLYFDAGMSSAGIAALEQCVRRTPQDPEALVMLGERAAADGRTTEAAMLFEKAAPAVEAFRENPRRRQNLQVRLYSAWAMIDEGSENWAAAQQKLENLIRLDARNAAAHERLGRALFRQGQGEKAYAEFQAAAAADPKVAPAEIAMASLFNDKNKAEQWLARALKLSGTDVRTQVAVGNYRMRENQLEEAKSHADEALKIDPSGLEANLLAGLVARLRADYPAAAKHLGAAHLLAPADPTIVNHLALVLIELPDEASRARALQFAELNARQNPNAIECAASLGWIDYRLNRKAEAQRVLGAAFKAAAAAHDNKMNSEMAYYLAVLSKDTGNVPFAIRTLKSALDSNQPFAYRKPAQELLAQLEKLPPTPDSRTKATSAARSTKSGEDGKGTDKAAP
jgi:tetratricopeptide (TPR) repeat protein